MSNKQKTLLCRAIVALLALPAVSVDIAGAQTTDKEVSAAGIQSITVTARRREELLQDVPGSVSAFSGAALEQTGVPDITKLADFVPNTTLKAARGTNTSLMAFMRGVGQQELLGGFEPGVGIYLDDIYLARPQGALMDIYNVERIEVLRGPQGTLYGRNTIGGAVKYVTRKLSAKPEVDLKASLGTYGERDVIATASSPVSDTVRVGGTVASMKRDGFGKNLVTGADNYDKDILGGRVSAEFLPTSNLFIRFAADQTTDDSGPKQGYRLTPGPKGEPVLANVYDTTAGMYQWAGKNQKVQNNGESLLIDWEINPTLSLKSITAHRSSKSTSLVDYDSLQGVYADAAVFYTDRQLSQEFQLTYTGAKLQGVAGVYYLDANAFNEGGILLPNAGGITSYFLDNVDTKTWAAYTDLSYSLSDAFNVTAGGRFTNDNRKMQILSATYVGFGWPTGGNPAAKVLGVANTDLGKNDLSRTDTKFTPKIGFGWKFAPEQNLYASYSEGFKGGLFDPRMNLGGNPNSPASLVKREGVKPEEVSTYELGLKSRFHDGRVQTNAAIFYSDYTNVQIPGFVAASGVTGLVGTLTNAGKAKISGIELETLARITGAFSLSGTLGYIDAQYKTWLDATGANIAGQKHFQNTPRLTASLTAAYDWPMALYGRNGGLSLSNSLAYKSKIYQFEDPSALDQEAYTLWNASLVWTSKDKKFLAGLHARNLTNKHYVTGGYLLQGFSNTITANYGDPRTLTATAEWRF